MPTLFLTNDLSLWRGRSDYHILTYAEEGFAPLNMHGQQFCIRKDVLVGFADSVNKRNETGSLHPLAPISAVPRTLIRDELSADKLVQSIIDFFRVNQTAFQVKNIFCNFAKPKLETFVLDAIQLALLSREGSQLAEVAIFKF